MKVINLSLFLFVSLSLSCSVSGQTGKPASADAAKFRAAADYSRESRGLAVLVIKNGDTVFEEYQNGHSAESSWMLASGTKSFAGVMLAAAIEDKLIKNFDEKVSDTITEWKTDKLRSKITIRELLTLTGGLDGGAIGRPPAYSAAIRTDAKFETGEKYQYGPVPFQVFGEVMRRKLKARNESVMEYMKRRIFEPIGLKIASWTMQEGQPNLPSGAYLTAREWAKFGQLLLNNGKVNGKQIIASKLLDELYKGTKANPNYGITFWLNRSFDGTAAVAESGGRFRRLLGNENETGTTAMSKYGIGKDIPKDLYMAAGAGNQRLYIIPSLDLVIVRQGRMAKFEDREFLFKLLPAVS